MSDLSHLPTAAEVFAEMDAEMDVEARTRWERTALARGVANAVVAYRTAHCLSQGALAAKMGMKRPAISRLELGEHNPSIETLQRLASGLGLRFIVDVVPPGRTAATLPPDVRVVGDTTGADGTRVLVASGQTARSGEPSPIRIFEAASGLRLPHRLLRLASADAADAR